MFIVLSYMQYNTHQYHMVHKQENKGYETQWHYNYLVL